MNVSVIKIESVRVEFEWKAYVGECPVPRATSCAFGGPDLQTLFITSSYETLNEKQLMDAPLSGSLFSIGTGVKGLESPEYEG